MDLNLRKAVIHNVSGNSEEQLKNTIVEAIESNEEKTLPGLGVLFEIIWQHADQTEQEKMLTTLHDGLN